MYVVYSYSVLDCVILKKDSGEDARSIEWSEWADGIRRERDPSSLPPSLPRSKGGRRKREWNVKSIMQQRRGESGQLSSSSKTLFSPPPPLPPSFPPLPPSFPPLVAEDFFAKIVEEGRAERRGEDRKAKHVSESEALFASADFAKQLERKISAFLSYLDQA